MKKYDVSYRPYGEDYFYVFIRSRVVFSTDYIDEVKREMHELECRGYTMEHYLTDGMITNVKPQYLAGVK